MATALTCTNIVRRNGVSYVRWSDKVELEFRTAENVRDYIRDMRDGEGTGKDIMRAMLLDWWRQRDPNFLTPATIINKTITYDTSLAANIVRVT
jgi:hypothetical protein